MKKDQRKRNIELVLKYQGGDESALQTLVEENYAFILKVACEFFDHKKHEQHTFAGVATEALMKSAKTFNHKLGYEFLTYAGLAMRRDVQRARATDGGAIYVPYTRLHQHEDRNNDKRAAARQCGTMHYGGYIPCTKKRYDAASTEIARLISDAMDALEPIDRRIIDMHIEGVQAKAIAADIGCKRNAVYARIEHIKHAIRTYIEKVSGSVA